MPTWHAVTGTSNGLASVLSSPCWIAEAYDPTTSSPPPWCEFSSIWDTGATGTVITQAVIDQCGLLPIGMVQVHGVHGIQPAEVYLVNLRLPNGVAFPNVRVTKGELPGGAAVLIGMDVITTGDFSITNHGGKTTFSFRLPSQGHVDYVQEHARLTRLEAMSHGGGGNARKKKPPKAFGKNKRR